MARFMLFAAFAALLAAPRPADAAVRVLAAWSQYGENGRIEARLVTDAATCPGLDLDGASQPMSERAPPSAAFPVRVCVAPIAPGARHARAGGLNLPVPTPVPRHIVVFGDTGCRIKGIIVQNCRDYKFWPFSKNAQHAAQEHPDLMIHLGDYLYRESPCQPGDVRCSGSPWGDNWATWDADFFTPGAALLQRTVWLMARGNHEDCRRAGMGFNTLLGHDAMSASCNRHQSPLLLDLGSVKLAMLDDNDAVDLETDRSVAAPLAQDLALAVAAHSDWIITHHPFRGISKPEADGNGKTMEGSNHTLLSALSGLDESHFSLMLSGHIHNFQILNLSGGTPQLIVGEGGDRLDTEVPPVLTGLSTAGWTVTQGLSLAGFGYVVLDRVRDTQEWTIRVHDPDGQLLRRCALRARKLSCQAAHAA